jgi:hypothetical protein
MSHPLITLRSNSGCVETSALPPPHAHTCHDLGALPWQLMPTDRHVGRVAAAPLCKDDVARLVCNIRDVTRLMPSDKSAIPQSAENCMLSSPSHRSQQHGKRMVDPWSSGADALKSTCLLTLLPRAAATGIGTTSQETAGRSGQARGFWSGPWSGLCHIRSTCFSQAVWRIIPGG